MAQFTPAPTYAEVVVVDEITGKGTFAPIWLKWFLDLTSFLSEVNAIEPGTGLVTSVGLSAPSIFIVTGSPITTAGTLGFTPVNPGSDQIVFWDDSASAWAYLTAGAGLLITGTTLTAPGAAGTVTSVALSAPDIFTVSGSPVTISGTLGFTPTDPNVDAIVFWDDSAGKWQYLTIGAGLAITGTVLAATASGGTVTNVALATLLDDTETVSGSPVTTTGTLTLTAVDAGVDKLVGWDDSAGRKIYFTLGTGLSTTGTTLNVTAGTGTVTSVAFAKPNDDTETVSGSPVTTAGTLTLSPVDAGADTLVGWDDSAGKKIYFTLGTGLSTTGTTLNVTAGAGSVTDVALAVVNDDTVTVSGSPVTTTGTLTETAVDAGVDKLVGWDESAGKKIYYALGTNLSTSGTTLNAASGGGGSTIVLPFFQWNGVPPSEECLLRVIFPVDVTFADDFAGSKGYALNPATSAVALIVQKNGSTVGTINFAPFASVPSFTSSGAQTFTAAGDDVLEVFAPTIPDGTFADFSVTLLGTL